MINEDVLKSFKKRYSHVYPLIFHRSVERATSAGHLFDILETIPDRFPLVWNEKKKCWAWTTDISQVERFSMANEDRDEK
jgi:hypothetical protein